MKIIAKITDSQFLIEASSDEIAKIFGYQSSYYLDDKEKKIRVGATIDVAGIYENLQNFKTVVKFNANIVKQYENQIAELKKIKMPEAFLDAKENK